MMFYTSVSGWLLYYFVSTASGKFVGLDAAGVEAQFGELMSSPVKMIIFTFIIIFFGFFVCSFSLQKGLEKITKVMMIALLVIMVVLAANSLFMKGGSDGLKFYLLPDVNQVKEVGLLNVITGAMSQAFFTLSLGIGSMAIFGSFIGKDRSLLGESVTIASLDTFVAIAAGLIIFPACFTYGVQPDAGPNLLFVTLPLVFANMPGGRIWGILFFLFMSFAAISSVLAAFQNIVSCPQDLNKKTQKAKKWQISLVSGIILFILSIPCVLGWNVLSGFNPFGGTSNIMDLEDFIVSNVLLPVGALVFVLFCTTKKGWGYENFMEEANQGKGLKVKKWMKYYLKYVLPVILSCFIIINIVNFFI
jgi:NSS family neurotransmitter:Na+ symporter